MGSPIVKRWAVGLLWAEAVLAPCQGQVTLSWDPSPSAGVALYHLCWGTSSGIYTFTNTFANSQTSGTISNLATNRVYFIAAQTILSNGSVSPFSAEISFTNESPGLPPDFVSATNSPPILGSGSPSNSPAQVNGGISPVVSGNGASSVGSSSAPTNCAANFLGIPPVLTMTVSNGQPHMNITGTLGATMLVQTMTYPSSSAGWETVTNMTLTNTAPAAQSNQASQTQDILDKAFVPAAQDFPVCPGRSTAFQLYRVVMPYDYAILGSIVLKSQGFTPRLIVVNMPGIVCDDGCYVNESASFIHYDRINAVLQLIGSHPSIREIANTLADSLNLDWTSASEFTYANGLGQILATVVETESAASDPVAGQNPPSPPMVIDF
ncbi:MAG: hypothetical protein ACLQVY_08630 [Limisphaerales bacterium]